MEDYNIKLNKLKEKFDEILKESSITVATSIFVGCNSFDEMELISEKFSETLTEKGFNHYTFSMYQDSLEENNTYLLRIFEILEIENQTNKQSNQDKNNKLKKINIVWEENNDNGEQDIKEFTNLLNNLKTRLSENLENISGNFKTKLNYINEQLNDLENEINEMNENQIIDNNEDSEINNTERAVKELGSELQKVLQNNFSIFQNFGTLIKNLEKENENCQEINKEKYRKLIKINKFEELSEKIKEICYNFSFKSPLVLILTHFEKANELTIKILSNLIFSKEKIPIIFIFIFEKSEEDKITSFKVNNKYLREFLLKTKLEKIGYIIL